MLALRSSWLFLVHSLTVYMVEGCMVQWKCQTLRLFSRADWRHLRDLCEESDLARIALSCHLTRQGLMSAHASLGTIALGKRRQRN